MEGGLYQIIIPVFESNDAGSILGQGLTFFTTLSTIFLIICPQIIYWHTLYTHYNYYTIPKIVQACSWHHLKSVLEPFPRSNSLQSETRIDHTLPYSDHDSPSCECVPAAAHSWWGCSWNQTPFESGTVPTRTELWLWTTCGENNTQTHITCSIMQNCNCTAIINSGQPKVYMLL